MSTVTHSHEPAPLRHGTALCPGCNEPTQSTVTAKRRTWHITCYRDPVKVAAYRKQRRLDEVA